MLICIAEGVTMTVIKKRSVVLHRHKTSISLESSFWKSLCEIADQKQMIVSRLAQQIDDERTDGNLSSAIRIFVLNHLRAQLASAHVASQVHGAPAKRPNLQNAAR
jgi:predicted DNA-binding ribbon-helix-helix protein